MESPIRIAIFASGSGTNAELIIQHFQRHPNIEVALLLSNNPTAKALARATQLGIETHAFNKSLFHDGDDVLDELKTRKITHIILAGFLLKAPLNLIQAFPKRIVNIHPALLPKFGGKGMYGMKVHEAVKAANEKETGITIHEVSEQYDEGKIIFQESCEVVPTDTPEQIANKVQQLEHQHFPKVIENWITNNH